MHNVYINIYILSIIIMILGYCMHFSFFFPLTHIQSSIVGPIILNDLYIVELFMVANILRSQLADDTNQSTFVKIYIFYF